MRKALVAFILLFLPSTLWAWTIKDYQVQIKVEKTGEMGISERITVDFKGERRHGIYRDIPLTFKDPIGRRHRIKIKNISVYDDMARPRTVKIFHRGDWVRIRVGKANRLVTGIQNYVINYRVKYAIYRLGDYDELYWNVIGHGWAVPIQKAGALLELPFSGQPIQITCYTGGYGSQRRDCQYKVQGSRISFTLTRPLLPHQGVTIGVDWPPGLVKATTGPPFWESVWFWVILYLVVLFCFFYWLWWTRGRDIGGRGVIQVQYHPPEGMTPLEAGCLIDERMDVRDVVAEIVDLARRGHLTIEEVEEEGLFFMKKKDYIFRKEEGGENLHDKSYDLTLLTALFPSGNTQRLSGLKKKFYAHLPQIERSVFSVMKRKGYFLHNPATIRNTYRTMGIVIGMLTVFGVSFLGRFLGTPPLPLVVAGLGTAALFLGFGQVMPRKTAKGHLAWERLKGYEEFISRVEKPVIEKLFTPHEIPQVFQEALPYAIAFGEAEKWASAFQGLFQEPPSWYRTSGVYSPVYMGHSLEHFSRAASTTLASAPRSAGGGGGFSGGGGGGGGGGAW